MLTFTDDPALCQLPEDPDDQEVPGTPETQPNTGNDGLLLLLGASSAPSPILSLEISSPSVPASTSFGKFRKFLLSSGTKCRAAIGVGFYHFHGRKLAREACKFRQELVNLLEFQLV